MDNAQVWRRLVAGLLVVLESENEIHSHLYSYCGSVFDCGWTGGDFFRLRSGEDLLFGVGDGDAGAGFAGEAGNADLEEAVGLGVAGRIQGVLRPTSRRNVPAQLGHGGFKIGGNGGHVVGRGEGEFEPVLE